MLIAPHFNGAFPYKVFYVDLRTVFSFRRISIKIKRVNCNRILEFDLFEVFDGDEGFRLYDDKILGSVYVFVTKICVEKSLTLVLIPVVK